MMRNAHISEPLNNFVATDKRERCRREFSDEGYGEDGCGGGVSTMMTTKSEFTFDGSDSGVESTVSGGCQRCRTTEGGDSETEAGCVIGNSNGQRSPTSARKFLLGEGETNGNSVGVGGGCVEGAHSSTASYDGASENGSESSSVEDTKKSAGVGNPTSSCGFSVVCSSSKICNAYGGAGCCKSSRKSASASSGSRLKVPFSCDASRLCSPKPTTTTMMAASSKMPPFEYEKKSKYGSSSSTESKSGRSLRSCSMTRSRTPVVSPDEPVSAKWATESRASSRSRLAPSGGIMSEKASCTFEAYATLPRRKSQKDGGDAKTNSPREPSLNRAASLRKKFLENTLMTTSFNGVYSSSTTLVSPTPSYVKTMPSYVKSKPPSKTKIYLEATTQTALTNSDIDQALSDHPFQLYNNLEIQEDAEYRIKKYYEEQMTSSNDEMKKLRKELCKQRTVIEWLEGELAASKDEKFTAQNRLATVEQRLYSLLRHKSSDGDDVLHQLEREVTYSNNVISQQQEEIAELQQMCCILKKDLEKSYSVQKTLVETQKATEAESMELQEFMQVEKLTLADSLRDTELELKTCRARLIETECELNDKKNELASVRTTCEELGRENTAIKARLCNLERRCRELLLHQGAAISSASVALSGLGSRFEQLLEQLVSSYDLSDIDLQDESQENQFPVDENGTNCSTTDGSEEEVVRRKASRKWLKAIGSAISKTFTEKQDRHLGITDFSNGQSSVILRKNSRLKNVPASSFEENGGSVDDDKRRESTLNLISTGNDDAFSFIKLETDSRRSSILAENLTLDFGTNDELPSDTTEIKGDLLLKDYSTEEVSLVEQINEIDNLISKAFKAILLTQTTTGAVPKEKNEFETTDANGDVAGETKRNDSIGSVSKFANKLVRLVKENGKTVPNGQCVPTNSNKHDNNETIAYLRMQQKAIKNTLGMLHKMPETVNESVFLKRIQTDLENVNQTCETFLSTAGNEITK